MHKHAPAMGAAIGVDTAPLVLIARTAAAVSVGVGGRVVVRDTDDALTVPQDWVRVRPTGSLSSILDAVAGRRLRTSGPEPIDGSPRR